ncbi:hypothetical protein BACCIP111895_00884 [Neobacillus rhizosphaerae]|uniref:Flavoprotein n=1 Tax=Neobacillus rhizosphaerae TaxID=2880965 RepID=A0ABN8KLM4_9BACI|nr:hypothetical protein [Neobacillus rhizosphaerae]CAH2713730.1 hypothetical protein BACCIP111895_00884 [Neobacillus rhizosphaerae]
MDVKTKVQMLVQQVVEAYLKEKTQKNQEKSIAILLGYQSPNPAEVMKAVNPLLKSYDVTLMLSKDWLPSINELAGKSYVLLEETSQQELLAIIEKSSVLVVPAASYRLLSKLALTMDDEVAVWLAIQFQLLGKHIVIANNYVEPNVYQQIHAPHSIQDRLQSYIRQIQVDQVKWVPLRKLIQTVEDQIAASKEKQALILAKHVEKAYQNGLNELVVPTRSKVTPSAKDLAKDLKIQINKTDSLKGGTQ